MRLDAIAMPSKSGLPSASFAAGFDQRVGEGPVEGEGCRVARRVAEREGAAGRGIRSDHDLVAFGDRRALIDEVGDQERPALGALAHGDVVAEGEQLAVGRGDDGVAHGDVDAAHA